MIRLTFKAFCRYILRKPHRISEERVKKLEGGERLIFRVEHAIFMVEHAPLLILGVHVAPFIIMPVIAIGVAAIAAFIAAWIISHVF